MNVKMLLVSAAALFIMGCDEMDGQLVVAKDFSVNVKNKQQTIAAGTYKTSLDFKKDKVQAEVKMADGNEMKVEFAIPKNSSLPDNGAFELLSSQTGQAVDVVGHVTTTQTQSDVQRGYESCQYTDYQNVCGPQGCFTAPVTRYGQQFTEYYVRTTDKAINFDMISGSAKVAAFRGASAVSQRVVLRQDRCF